MPALSSQVVLKALDGLTERAAVIAQNIANAGTPNYRPRQVTFEGALAQAAAAGPGAVRTVAAKVEQAPMDTPLRLDLEVASASTTALRYEALIEILNRRQAIDALPLTAGR